MTYAFKYEAYDRPSPEDDSRTYKNSVDVTVQAKDEQDAEAAVKLLLVREAYRLDEIIELSEDLMPIKSGF